jgi:hypothetical protein
MAIEGSLGTLPFADLLQILGSTRKTGTLNFNRGPAWKKLYLRDGVVVATASSDPEEWFGPGLVALRKVSEADLTEARARQLREDKSLGMVLVDMGRISQDALVRYLGDLAYEMMAKLLTWNDASFKFEEFALPKAEMVPLDMSIEQLLMEGFRRADEIGRLRELVPGEDVLIEPTGTDPGEEVLDRTLVGALYRKLDRPTSVRQLRRALKATEFSLLEGIARLMEKGVLRRHVPAPPPPPDPDWEAMARKLGIAGFHEQALEVLHRVLAHEPSNTVARKLLDETEEAYAREVTRRELPLDAVLELGASLEDLADRSVSPAEAFLLGRVNGLDVASILELTPLRPAETLISLKRLLSAGHLRKKK